MDNSFVRDSAGTEIPLWPAAKPEHSLAERRAALAQLQAQGFHLVALLRWNPESWPHGIRSEHSLRRLPIDLRDAFDRCRALTTSYGDLIDYWEIDNEPDIGFVEENPETYAAFLKACYLGIAAGRPMADAGGQTPEARGPEDQKARKPENQNAGVSGERANLPVEISDSSSRASGPPILGPSGLPSSVLRPPSSRTRSRVLMAPLALPPGPYFTAFIANGGLRYTDGFNYHYYGYASDFTGVYEQFRNAVTEAVASDDGGLRPDAGNPEDQKSGPSAARPSAPPIIGSSGPPPLRPSGPPSSVLRPPSSVLRPPPSALPSDVAVLTTRFYPNTRGWVSVPIFDFDFPAAAAAAHRAQLETRPLADGEPRLTPQGRWLVSSGVTVEETPGTWRIRVDRLPAEPMRPAVAELPLPDGWESDPNTLLTFAYRIVPEGELKAGIPEGQMTGRPEGPMVRGPDDQRASVQTSAPPTIQPSAPSTFGSSDHPASAQAFRPSDPPPLAPSALSSSVLRPPASVRLPLAHRELPVFLTEYGYGLLGKEARDTVDGRARQAAWFTQVQFQIRTLGLSHAMAFLLKPYLENNRQEFGLLTSLPSGRSSPERSPLATLASPALKAILADSTRSLTPQDWPVSEPRAETGIVIDFVASTGLAQAKSYSGYLVRGDFGTPGQPAQGRLVLYNLNSSETAGELHLEGNSWSLSASARSVTLSLAPQERQEIPVFITPEARFRPQPVRATFRPLASATIASSAIPLRPSVSPSESLASASSGAETLPIAATAPVQLPFNAYLRTANGNLYSAGSTLAAMETVQSYRTRLGNLTLAFFGRAESPWAFVRNEPAALVLYVRPGTLPVELEITHPSVVKPTAP